MCTDEFYLNFHTTLFQFLLGLPMMIPAAPAQGVDISDIGNNFRDGNVSSFLSNATSS
jgi:hypothetical protein